MIRTISLLPVALLCAILTFASMSQSVAGQAGISPLQCAGAFQALQFNILDFSQFPKYFADDSVAVLREAGSFQGADGIEEYLRFVDASSPYFLNTSVKFTSAAPVGFDPQSGSCAFLISFILRQVFNPRMALPVSIDLAVAAKVTFSAPRNVITKVNLYYTIPAQLLISQIVGTDHVRRFVCRTLKNKCPDTYRRNGSPSMAGCVSMMRALPVESEGAYFDGFDQGCRRLHAVFAVTNQEHCAHISFFPAKDPKGKIKCQKSEQIKIEDIFSREELGLHSQTIAQQGMDPVAGMKLVCEDSPVWTSPLGDGSGGCNWVRKSPPARCAVEGAAISCSKTCHELCKARKSM